MTDNPKKIVYLFGAGASEAERINTGLENSVLTSEVTSRVIKQAYDKIPEAKDLFSTYWGNETKTNIEQFISLLSELKVEHYNEITKKLKELFRDDIESNLKLNGKQIDPKIACGLLEYHRLKEVCKKEILRGFLTLNYDSLIDSAYNVVYEKKINMFVETTLINDKDLTPIIKLHGSFDWEIARPIKVGDTPVEKNLWLPPGIEKIPTTYPFNMLWGKAEELLQCDVLRVVGCSMHQNDWGLLSLLFRTQLLNQPKYNVEIINYSNAGQEIMFNFPFIKNIFPIHLLDGCADLENLHEINEPYRKNVFKEWLYRKAKNIADFENSVNLKNLVEEYSI